MATKIEAVWDKDKEISMLRKALHNADTEICELRNKHKREEQGKSLVKVPVGEVLKVVLEIPANAEPGKHIGKIIAIEETDSEETKLNKQIQAMRKVISSLVKEKENYRKKADSFDNLYKQERAERICLKNNNFDLSREKDIIRDKWCISNSEVIACKSKIDSLKDMLRTSAVFNVILGIATLVFACFTNF